MTGVFGMSGQNIRVYLDEETSQLLDQLEDDIKDIYGKRATFFQSQIKSLANGGTLKARKKMLERKKNQLQDELDAIDAQIQGLEQQIDDEEDENLEDVAEDELQQHPEYDRAMRILKQKYRDNMNELDTTMQPVQYWSKELGVSTGNLIDHVESEVEA